jgi:hemerythrin
MSDRTPEQMNLDVMVQAITAFTHSVEMGFERFEQHHQDHETLIRGQESRIELMEEAQRDTREMLRILVERTSRSIVAVDHNPHHQCREPIKK